MKTGIHPDYHQITIACACGNSFTVGSTQKEDMRVEICSQCHPLYTGKANLIDTAGRLDKFKARQDKAASLKQTAAGRTTKTAKEADSTDAPEKTEK